MTRPLLRLRPVLLAALLALPAFAACRAEEPKSPAVGLTKPVEPPTMPDLGRAPGTVEVDGLYSMYIADSVQSICAGPDPFFRFDSSKPKATDQPTMANLVTCMMTGPLKGHAIKLIGHTDPRGTAQYNDDLGIKRADKVKRFLVANGVDEGRVLTASAGADDASPQPKDWGTDRRVEIQLAR